MRSPCWTRSWPPGRAERLTTVIDTLGLDTVRRRSYLRRARAAGLPAVLIVFDTPAALCRERNAGRDRAVPAPVLTAQLRKLSELATEWDAEGWDLVVRVGSHAEPARSADSPPATPSETPARAPDRLEVILQVSRFPWADDPSAWLREIATAAAEIGFGGIALMDHLIQIPQVGRAWDPIPEPWVSLGFLAGLDLPLRLGTLVSPVTFRDPGIIAKTVATLDVLSSGRAFCGLGAGWWAREHDAYGLDFPAPKERLDQLQRCIDILRALWSPGTKAFTGSYASLPETTCYPRPAQPVPILVGGSGERRTLRIAAEQADGCNLPSDAAVLPGKIDVLRRHCAAVGRDPSRGGGDGPRSADHRPRPRGHRGPGRTAPGADAGRDLRRAPPRRAGARPCRAVSCAGRPGGEHGVLLVARPDRSRRSEPMPATAQPACRYPLNDLIGRLTLYS